MAPQEKALPYNTFRKASLLDGEEIVITGIAGRFPESDNLNQFRENLMSKRDLITDDGRRWTLDHPEIPQRTGKVNNINKFDADFFDYGFKEAHTMDPMGRMLLEHAYEAIIDAGINPKHLKDTNTGVFVGACFSESEISWVYQKPEGDGLGVTGCCRGLLGNRLSQWLGVKGPSYTVDSACSSSLLAMEHAYRAISTGVCDAALVCGANLCIQPIVSFQFARLGVLSRDGRSKAFDNAADGYARGETISVVFLQKAKDAKRIYATIVYGKSNCDGYKPQGITFPSSDIQGVLLKEFYEECNVSATSLEYVEAHGTGTSVGDPEELNAIAAVLCPGRNEPLMIGSVKSNIGHAEPASGMGQIAKVVIAYEAGVIPPTLHYKTPREGVKALIDGRLKVVTEPTPWNGGYVGISSFGFGGANAHILLKSNPKKKINGGAPQDNLPRLVVASGRTEKAVDSLLSNVESRPVDVEYIRLLHNLHAEELSGHLYRGYTIVGGTNPGKKLRKIAGYTGVKRPIWFVFSGMDSQWPAMGTSLLRFPVFANAMKKCDVALKPLGVDIHGILTNPNESIFAKLSNTLVGIAAMQIGLVDLLTSLGIVPDAIVGHSFGELGCAYTDGSFTAEQMVLAAYSLGFTLLETEKIGSSMATVNLSSQQLEKLCPPDIEVVWHNSPVSSTISGPIKSIKAFVAKLIADNFCAQEIACNNIAHNSRYMADIGPELFAHLKRVIPKPKPRSSKWFSTSIPKSQWNSPQAKLSSAEYYTNNFLSPVLFEQISGLIPKDAVMIEIAPHGLLQGILKGSLNPEGINISLSQGHHENNAEVFLQAMGKLYGIGLQPAIWKLYPEIKFPVSRGTPMISPLIKWEHSEDWFVTTYQQQDKITSGERRIELSLNNELYDYMDGHIIDGRNLLPATGYLALIWESVAMMRGLLCTEVPIVFEDVNFLRATTVSKEPLKITLMLQKGTGRFEVIEGGVAVVTGVVRDTSNIQLDEIKFSIPRDDQPEEMTTKDVYKELKLRGYQYSGLFRAIQSATTDGTRGTIRWNANWVAFMDNMLQMRLLGIDCRSLLVPTRIQKVVIDTKEHSRLIRSTPCNKQDLKVYVSKEHDLIVSGGIQIRGLEASAISRRKPAGEPVLETYKFVPHKDRAEICLKEAIRLAVHLSLENHLNIKVKTLESLEIGEKYPPEDLLSFHIAETLADLPMIQADFNIVTPQNPYEDEELPQNLKITEPKKLTSEINALILAGRDLLKPEKSATFSHLLSALRDGAFVLALESSSPEGVILSLKKNGLHIVFDKIVDGTRFLLLRKIDKLPKKTIIIQVNNEDFTWIDHLKAAQKTEIDSATSGTSRILLISDKNMNNGLLGLVNCLRREPGGEIVRGLLIQHPNAPEFSLSAPIYADQLKLDLAINVLRPESTWGSYRHLPLPLPTQRPVHHAWANQLVKGDLTSFRWLEGPITPDSDVSDFVRVVYSSINFKDIMLATGKLAAETFIKNRRAAECVLGFEYAGITTSGFRVMGIGSRAMTNILTHYSNATWPVPDSWTLEEAATVPCVYATCVYALYIRGKMNKGDKILIHAGSGGVGQAAINLALWTECEVFTTVGTPEKRAFIRETFPQIPDDHIGNSRDTSFEQLVMDRTNGKGVDIVLNSLADDKLQASIRCLSEDGRFLEIGKFDMANNSPLGMSAFSKGISFHGILVDKMFDTSGEKRDELHELMQKLLDERAVKPLNATIFSRDQIESAFRYMASGKHIGKVILKIQDENSLGAQIPVLPRYYCRNDRSYVILGGLGGFGLELADWLILRGAQHVILTSRSGVKNGYQSMRMKIWESYGVKVTIISGKEASDPSDCEDILSIASEKAPVDAIFNLAVVLKDSLFENQTVDTFVESFKAKAWGTSNLDKLSRRFCPKLRHFVVFSSVSCGRGNTGQTNYGMSNSVMERICERRATEGLPALAIQWGAIGDVGLVADMQDNDKELVIGGTLQQKITSCLYALDGFLNQSSPIVASMMVAEKRTGGFGSLDIVGTVLNIMGLRDLKSVSVHTPLAELGMDSMMAVEIKQTLEREFEIFLTAQDIRGLNFAKLIEMNSKNAEQKKNTGMIAADEALIGIRLLVSLVGDNETINQVYLKLPTKGESQRPEIFFIPGLEGCGDVFKNLAKNIKAPATCLQFFNTDTEYLSIQEIAFKLKPYVLERNAGRMDFVFIGYSFGSLVAIELARILESDGLTGKLILIDGSAAWLKGVRNQQIPSDNNDELETNILVGMVDTVAPTLSGELFMEFKKCQSWEEKLDIMMARAPKDNLALSVENRRNMCTCIYRRLLALDNYDTSSLPPIESPIILLKSILSSVKSLPEDYGLSKVTNGKVEAYSIEGNHLTILDNEKVARVINGEPLEDLETGKSSIMKNEKMITPLSEPNHVKCVN